MLEKIKKIREQTGAGMVNIKEALVESRGNEEKAIEILRKKGQDKALKKEGRETKEGVVVSYIHSNKKIGAMVKLYCETDFVGLNDEFQELAKDIAMQVVAMNPQVIRPEDVSAELVAKEKEIWTEQLKSEGPGRAGKPEAMLEKIMAGKEEKFRKDLALLTQPFVKDPKVTIDEIIKEKIGKIGENIQVGEFVRFEL